MIYHYLKGNCGLEEPIFAKDIQIPGMSEENLRYHLKSLLTMAFRAGVFYRGGHE